MMLWIIFIVMALIALALLVVPLLRRNTAAPSAGHDTQVYRDQLTELEQEVQGGLISGEEEKAARLEIARRILATGDGSPAGEDGKAAEHPESFAPVIISCVVLLGAFGLYLSVGSPELAERRNGSSEQMAQAGDGPDIASLINELGEKLKSRPDDLRGWSLYARTLTRQRRFAEASAAWRRVTTLAPDDAGLWSERAEAEISAAKGIIGAAARKSLVTTLKLDPREPRARYYLGLAESQAGRRAEALKVWLALEADSPPDAPWVSVLTTRIKDLAAEAGIDAKELAARRQKLGITARAQTPRDRGPSAEDVEAAQSLVPKERMAFIRTMVARLAERLEGAPDDADGWQKLGRSYRVLGDAVKSKNAYAKAAALRPKDVAVLSAYAGAIARTTDADAPISSVLAAVSEQILALAPDHGGALWFSGIARFEAGDTPGARGRWQRLLSIIDPSSAQYAEVKKRIAALDKLESR
jgi:cytochrome c-type biogenesis protein CcmH